MKKVDMTMKAFVAEHKKLIKILKEGNKIKLRKEAVDQAKELNKVLKKKK